MEQLKTPFLFSVKEYFVSKFCPLEVNNISVTMAKVSFILRYVYNIHVDIHYCYIDKSVLVENRPLVKFIRNYILESSGVFPYPR